MNKIIKNSIIICTLAFSFSSCKKFLKEDLNNDVTSLAYPDPKVTLPEAIANLAFIYGGEFTRYDALMTQQVTGAGNQALQYQNYTYVQSDFNTSWDYMYSTTLNNLSKLQAYATSKNMYHYAGISKILTAFSYSIMVDHWNNVPFTEALQAPAVLQPKYDNGSDIYTGIFTMLNDADSLLAKTDAGRVPGADDILFGGDANINNWVEFSHALRARMYLHLKNYSAAQSELTLANNIDAKFIFQSPSSGPMSQFDASRTGDLDYMSSYLFTTMSTIGDKRVYAYTDTTNNQLGSLYVNPQQPIFFISAMEQKFMLAEILARAGDPVASASYKAAVNSSFSLVGDTAGSAATLAAYPYNTADPLPTRLNSVMTQKYFAMYLQPEAFADWRRTGIPVLTPITGANIPRRYLYPSDEKSTNLNMPSGVTLYSPKVFWDN